MKVIFSLFLCIGFLSSEIQGQLKANPDFEPEVLLSFDSHKNLFLGAKTSSSPSWQDRIASFAVDGKKDQANNHWGAENIPVWLRLDFAAPEEINAIRVFPYWGDKRTYQFFVEASEDGETWKRIIDQTDNQRPARSNGETFFFPDVTARSIRITFTRNSKSNVAGGHLVEIEGYRLPGSFHESLRRWSTSPDGLHASFASLDHRFPKNEHPDLTPATRWQTTGWRGERVQGQALLFSKNPVHQIRLRISPLQPVNGRSFSIDAGRARFVRYVLADGELVPDILDHEERLDLAGQTVRPVWISVDIPKDADPGLYTSVLTVSSAGNPPIDLPFQVEVLPLTLPPPSEWSFHLDLWQNPYALARYHHLKVWGKEHLTVLLSHLRMLADAGQKCITTTIVHQPWGTQTFDPYDSMVEWIQEPDGSFSFDYSNFDAYVTVAEEAGITSFINCYSLVPWTERVRYLERKSGTFQWIATPPGSDEFHRVFGLFLADFVVHLKQKGWLQKTRIAMDERPLDKMIATRKLIKDAAPELGMALAGNYHRELDPLVDDYCVFLASPFETDVATNRVKSGKPTTFYVCTSPVHGPNTFTSSPPAESVWLAWYALARGYNGFLRWAYDSWVEDPLFETSHVTWRAGDCFLVYPNERSSIRFERLREGIQDFEKVRILRERGLTKKDAERLEAHLKRFTWDRSFRSMPDGLLNDSKKLLEDLSRSSGNQGD